MAWAIDPSRKTETFPNLGTVREVPGDGNCVLYALQECLWVAEDPNKQHNRNDLVIGANDLRKKLGEHITFFFTNNTDPNLFESFRNSAEASHDNEAQFKTVQDYSTYVSKDQVWLGNLEFKFLADMLKHSIEIYYYVPNLDEFVRNEEFVPTSSTSTSSTLRLLYVAYQPGKEIHDYVIFPGYNEDTKKQVHHNHYLPIINFTKKQEEQATTSVNREISIWLTARLKLIIPLLLDRQAYLKERDNLSVKGYSDEMLQKLDQKFQIRQTTVANLNVMLESIQRGETRLDELRQAKASQDLIQNKQERIGITFNAILTLIKEIAKGYGTTVDMNDMPQVFTPDTDDSAKDDSITNPPPPEGTYEERRDPLKIYEKPYLQFFLMSLQARFDHIINPANRMHNFNNPETYFHAESSFQRFYHEISWLPYDEANKKIDRFVWDHSQEITRMFWFWKAGNGVSHKKISRMINGSDLQHKSIHNQRFRIYMHFSRQIMQAWVNWQIGVKKYDNLKKFWITDKEVKEALQAIAHGKTYKVPERIRHYEPVDDRSHYIAAFIHAMKSFVEIGGSDNQEWWVKYVKMQDPNQRGSKTDIHNIPIVYHDSNPARRRNYILGEENHSPNQYYIQMSPEFYTHFASDQLKLDI